MMAYEAVVPVDDTHAVMLPVNVLPSRPLW